MKRIAEVVAPVWEDPPAEVYEAQIASGLDAPLLLAMPDGPLFLRRAGHPREYTRIDTRLLRGELARQYHDDIPLWVEGKPVAPGYLIEQYAEVVHQIVYDLTGERLGFERDPRGCANVLCLPCARLDPTVKGAENAECAEWLRLFFGADVDRGLDWIASAADLTRPTSALYCQGPPSAGKGLLAAALAGLWGTTPTEYADVAGPFNSALKHSPIVFLDEGAPKSLGSEVFRSLVSESSRPLKEKMVPTGQMLGCVRLIIAANNEDALRIRGELTLHDEQAIGARVFHVNVGEEAGRYLEGLGGRAYTQRWTTGPRTLVRHLRWLVDQREVRAGARFIVAGDSDGWIRRRGLRGGLEQDICAAIAQDASSDRTDGPFDYRDGVVVVSVDRLRAAWEKLALTKQVPSANAMGRALRILGERRRSSMADRQGRRPWHYEVEVAKVVEVADALGVGDPDAIRGRCGAAAEAPAPVLGADWTGAEDE